MFMLLAIELYLISREKNNGDDNNTPQPAV